MILLLLLIILIVCVGKLLFSFAGVLLLGGLIFWLIFLGGAVKIVKLIGYFFAKVFNTFYDAVYRGK